MASRAMSRAWMLIAASAAPAAFAEVARDACGESGSCRADGRTEDSRGTVLLQVQPAALSQVSEHRAIGMEKKCKFANPPEVPYYWEPKCNEEESEGCFADSVHNECRYCGEHPYTGIPCPDTAIHPKLHVCRFDNPPEIEFFWDVTCKPGDLGCKADGKHLGCRFCGGEDEYKDIKCPQCTFPNEPFTPYYVDETCAMGMLGCRADGVHDHCRFCGKRPWHSIPCPESVNIPEGECWFPNKQDFPHYWDPECEMGKLGCWADGIHAQCRYCGLGVYADVKCPDGVIKGKDTTTPEP